MLGECGGPGVGIQRNAQKGQCCTDVLANERIVFTDTRRALHPLLAAFQRQALESRSCSSEFALNGLRGMVSLLIVKLLAGGEMLTRAVKRSSHLADRFAKAC